MRRITRRAIELAHNVNIFRTKLMTKDLGEKAKNQLLLQIENANFELKEIEQRQMNLSKIKTR